MTSGRGTTRRPESSRLIGWSKVCCKWLWCAAATIFMAMPRSTHAQDHLRMNSGQPYLAAEETVRRFTVPDGFQVKLFAAEPQLINPIAMCFDERGRVWVIESFEYPKGTPPGQRPKDRIKIYEDTDGDHRADKITLYADGFNLATGIAVGHGGVFVGAAPDLLFLRDTDGDDRADTREVLLSGFGRQDTHELLNTFTWGPDGWLYGCHGVFTHSKVKRAGSDDVPVEMNAAVWRYHPRSRSFEMFAEGTSNPWGIDFDERGNMFLTCCVIPHMYHMIPGGRYIRQAGQNRNPYDFGQIKEISDHRHHEESGWAHAGCVVLEGELWPADLRGSVIFGSIHGNSIKRDVLRRHGSTFIASHAPDFLQSGDKNFRPVYQAIGPDGSIYITDWHDQWPCHQTPPDLWDKERGRIYKIVRDNARSPAPRDMGKLSNAALVDELQSPNPFVYRTALRLLAERSALDVQQELTGRLFSDRLGSAIQLRMLWALHGMAGAKPDLVGRLLEHSGEEVRTWAARMLGEPPATVYHEALAVQSGVAGQEIARFARNEPSASVRLQIAASCQRLSAAAARPILQALAERDGDRSDPAIPLMIWFALEPAVASHRDATLEWLGTNASKHEIVQNELLPRVMRRLAATGRREDLGACLMWAAQARESAVRRAALQGLVTAFEGRRAEPPPEWAPARTELVNDREPAVRAALLRLGASFRDPESIRELESIAQNPRQSESDRAVAVRAIAVARLDRSLATLDALFASEIPPGLRGEVLRALGAFDDPSIPTLVLGHWKSLGDAQRTEALTILTGRRDWADTLLDAVAGGTLERSDLSAAAATRIVAIKDTRLTQKLESVWGSVRPQTPAQLDELIRKMRRLVAAGKGNAQAGREVFQQKCAVCHKFDGHGADVGPDITGADRSVEYLLINILDPNRVVGQPYYTHVVATTSGRVITGKLVSDANGTLTLQGENNKLDVIPRDEVAEHTVKNISVMPEGLPKDMTEVQFRDLIEYLRRR